MSKEEELKQALRWALEWIDAVPDDTVLPAMPGFDRDYVEGLLSSATANKATEEGDRSMFEEWARRTHRRPGTSFNTAHDGTYVDNRIAAKWSAWKAGVVAGRASRQVANKSEVEPDPMQIPDVQSARKWMEAHGCGNATITAALVSQHCRIHALTTEGLDLARRLATHPATTGASTVLTDERIKEFLQEAEGDPCRSTQDAAQLIDKAAELVRDLIAAQAGQAEVPVVSSYDIEKVKAAKTKFIDALIHSGVQYRTCGAISATLNEIIDQSEAAAAPSPAKESK